MITNLETFEAKVCGGSEKIQKHEKPFEGYWGHSSDNETARYCLKSLKSSRADEYQSWLEVGMALHSAGCNVSDWDDWSKTSGKYQDGLCQGKWQTFKNNGNGLTVASLIEWARQDNPSFRLPEKVRDTVISNIWEKIVPFTELNLPKFPVECFPIETEAFINEVAGSLQVAVDMPALLALVNCSYCVSGTNFIQAKPDWIEPLNLYVAVLMPPASKKTAVFSIMTEPLEQYGKHLLEAAKQSVQENQSKRRVLEKTQQKLETNLARDENNDELKGQLDNVNRQIAEFVDLYSPTVLTTDATPEAVARLLFENNGRLGLFSAEGGIFGTMAGRYSNGVPTLDVYLQGHIGDNLRVNRIGRPMEYIEKPALTIGLAIQPTILENLKHKSFMQECGLLARFLYAMPEYLQDKPSFKTIPISGLAKDYYARLINRLLTIQNTVLTLTPEAQDVFAEYYETFESRLHGDLYSIAFWAGKLRGAVLRIAGIMQLIKGTSSAVEIETINNAISIGNYLIPHAQAVFETMDFDAELHLAHRVLKWIKRNELKEFSLSDVYLALRTSRASTMDIFRAALSRLMGHQYLKVKTQKTQGRPVENYYVNPNF